MKLLSLGRALVRVVVDSFAVKNKPSLSTFRATNNSAALVFIHGFSGDVKETWGDFPNFVCADAKVAKWDVYAFGYPSSLRIDVPIWDADPELATIALSLRTTLALPPFAQYKVIALAAHSMGGLVVQRALIDDPKLVDRISHLFLFGTPSRGLGTAGLFAGLKRQVRDMAAGSPFIEDLRLRWTERFSTGYRFEFRVVAGDRDEFVPTSSSLTPFPDAVQSVVSGNHLEIVKPAQSHDLSVQLLLELLAGDHHTRGLVEGARLAIERRQFHEAVDALLPRAESLDDAAAVSLALALDGLGKGKQALEMLEKRYAGRKGSTEVLGVLGGRIKRRWLTERAKEDLDRARELYMRGLEQAEQEQNAEQAYYHSINMAFLNLMAAPPDNATPAIAKEMAQRAKTHCLHSPAHFWRSATEGDAELILGTLDKAANFYSEALKQGPNPRSIDSMYTQAVQIAGRTHGELGVRRIDQVFKVSSM